MRVFRTMEPDDVATGEVPCLRLNCCTNARISQYGMAMAPIIIVRLFGHMSIFFRVLMSQRLI